VASNDSITTRTSAARFCELDSSAPVTVRTESVE
jgi:hypothetical protein